MWTSPTRSDLTLSAGVRSAPTRSSPLGAGGMGEVYRARDSRLERDVAIKLLSDALAQDPEHLARFEREARMLAALNHPGIGAIYGLEQQDGVRFLVLELVEGESLSDTLDAGPLEVEPTPSPSPPRSPRPSPRRTRKASSIGT